MMRPDRPSAATSNAPLTNAARLGIASAVAVALVGACKTTEPAGNQDPTPAAPSASAVAASAAPGKDKQCCMGLNDCKGKGGCAVSESNACAGQNECKGKGGCNMHCPK